MTKADLVNWLSLYTNNYWIFISMTIFVGIIIAIIFEKYIYPFVYKILKKTPTKINVPERIWIAIKRPISTLILMSLIYFALLIFPFSINAFRIINLYYESFIIALLVWSINSFINTFKDNKIEGLENLDDFSEELSNNYYAPYFVRLMQLTVTFFGFYFIVTAWGKDLSSLITALGFISVAIAFSLRDTFSNIFSGIVIILEKTFKIGDVVENDNIQGTIQDISFRSTKVITIDKEEIIVPNTLMVNVPLNNKSLSKMRKIEVYICIDYSSIKKFDKEIANHFNRGKAEESEFAKCQKQFYFENKIVYKFFEFTLLNGGEYIDWKQEYLQDLIDYCINENYNVHYIGFEQINVEKILNNNKK